MPPKKRDKDNETTKNSKIDHLQADHELFLQAFEKPTQIYRFLRTRNMLSPIFLNRTLSYMKRRMSRSNKSRVGFKVDSLLEKITLKKSTELQPNSLGGYMTLTFLGFYDKSLVDPRDYQVKVETLLLKICHKKRKESSSAIVEVSVGSCSLPLNPSTSEPPAMASAVSISSETFSPSQGPNVKSYMLMLRVTVTRNSGNTANGSGSSTEIMNGDIEEPATKRLKSADHHNSTPDSKWSKLYGSELIVYDKHNRCLLTNGEYDLVLHDATPGGRSATIARSPHKALMAQWETIPNDNDIQTDLNPFDIFKVRPLLKLKLSWSHEPTNGLVNRPKLYQQTETNGARKDSVTTRERPSGSQQKHTNDTKHKEKSKSDATDDSKRQQIIYQFLYNNNSRQQTEACDDLHCPWCSLDCGTLYSLLKHLKLCHSRFNFTYFPIPGGARIDVSINELYDGSYTGSPHDLIAAQGRSGCAGPRAGPTRRTCLTRVLIWRPRARRRPQRHSLSEFLELDDSELLEAQRPYLTGHNRLYHHTITCLPVYPNELDIDSENETDPLWLQQKTMMMIDEFTDVNEGEKELMKMWNLHVMKYNYVGDSQIPLACQMFLQMKGEVIACNASESRTYAVTLSKKSSGSEEAALCAGQKSFISIHSTDQLCQVADIENPTNLDDCNVEVLSLNQVFPSTSEDSLSNDDDTTHKKRNQNKKSARKPEKTAYVPTNSKSSTGSRPEPVEGQASVYSDFDIPKNTMCVIGSDPGEPKKSYQDPPKKISKTMKKFLRNIDKHKSEPNTKSGEKQALSKLTMRSILKDNRCGLECTGDSHGDEYSTPDDLTPSMDFETPANYNYGKQNPDKNVTFNTQVVIIHFTGDLCVGQSVETLSKEKDQQARNSELRKTFLTKYNEHWPTQKQP